MIRYLYCKAKGIEFIYGGALGMVDAFIDCMVLGLIALIVLVLL